MEVWLLWGGRAPGLRSWLTVLGSCSLLVDSTGKAPGLRSWALLGSRSGLCMILQRRRLLYQEKQPPISPSVRTPMPSLPSYRSSFAASDDHRQPLQPCLPEATTLDLEQQVLHVNITITCREGRHKYQLTGHSLARHKVTARAALQP